MSVLAYVNHGRWVADCSRPGCAGAESLAPRQTGFHCSNCHQLDEVVWPADAADIWDVLQERPIPQTRNWYPAGHPLAVRFRLEHGQSVEDLRREHAENEVA